MSKEHWREGVKKSPKLLRTKTSLGAKMSKEYRREGVKKSPNNPIIRRIKVSLEAWVPMGALPFSVSGRNGKNMKNYPAICLYYKYYC